MKFNLVLICFIITSCVGQPPAPIEYHSGKNFADKSSRCSYIVGNNEKVLAHDVEKIVSVPLNQQEKDFISPTGYLKNPEINKLTSQDDIIIVPQIKQDNRKVIYHEVQAGETLASIAGDYSQTIEELSKLNNILPPYNLQESQMLKIKISNELLNIKNKEKNLKNITKNLNRQEAQLSSIAPLPKFIKPVSGKIITKFGDPTTNGKNKGINIAADEGSIVYSIASGKVVYAGNHKQFGNLLIIKLDEEDLYTAYAHLGDLIFKKDSVVRQGEIIGHVGRTGNVNSPQLHFAIRKGKIAVNPLKYIQYDNN